MGKKNSFSVITLLKPQLTIYFSGTTLSDHWNLRQRCGMHLPPRNTHKIQLSEVSRISLRVLLSELYNKNRGRLKLRYLHDKPWVFWLQSLVLRWLNGKTKMMNHHPTFARHIFLVVEFHEFLRVFFKLPFMHHVFDISKRIPGSYCFLKFDSF